MVKCVHVNMKIDFRRLQQMPVLTWLWGGVDLSLGDPDHGIPEPGSAILGSRQNTRPF